MVRFILAVVLLITLVSTTSATGGGYKKKLFMKYATHNLFEKCLGKNVMDKFVLDYINAAKKCHNREFDAQLKPVYIKPYPVEGQNYNTRFTSSNVGYHTHPQQQYQQVPFQQYQQVPYPQQQQYQQFQQHPQYQQQQYQQQPQYQQQGLRQQQQYGFQQPQQFYGPGVGFQPIPNNQINTNQVLNRQVRQANKNKKNKVQNVQNSVVAETTVAGEAELYYYNKLKHHLTGMVGNFSCVMHEMGYFTEDNQINIQKYKQAYQKLTLPQPMKDEFEENIDLCLEVSECLPEKCFTKYPYGREYGRSFFFVMCEKKKAMEVCLKKQMVDDYYKYKDILADQDIPDNLDETEDLFSMGF